MKLKEIITRGQCIEYSGDTYTFAKVRGNLFIRLYDGDIDEAVEVVISEEDALDIANDIINAFK
jgi:hypothetical protein